LEGGSEGLGKTGQRKSENPLRKKSDTHGKKLRGTKKKRSLPLPAEAEKSPVHEGNGTVLSSQKGRKIIPLPVLKKEKRERGRALSLPGGVGCDGTTGGGEKRETDPNDLPEGEGRHGSCVLQGKSRTSTSGKKTPSGGGGRVLQGGKCRQKKKQSLGRPALTKKEKKKEKKGKKKKKKQKWAESTLYRTGFRG